MFIWKTFKEIISNNICKDRTAAWAIYSALGCSADKTLNTCWNTSERGLIDNGLSHWDLA